MKIEQTLKLKAYSEEEAKKIIEKFKEEANENGYKIKKAGYEYKTKKAKKEIVDEGYLVTVTQIYADFWE